MKILHTADWHLGRALRSVSLIDDQAHVLNQIFEIIASRSIDVLIVAGDIYDKASPPEAAVKLYSDFIERVYEETEAAIVVIAGNHDSGQRLGAVTKLLDKTRILIRGPIEKNEPPLLLEDEHGTVAFSALPYGEIYAARRVFGDENIRSPEDVLRHQVNTARQQKPDGVRWVIVAHAFVTDCQPSESERRLAVGTVEMVSQVIFEGADYVALGHLHRPQMAGSESIRYSGSPLAFGFDEADTLKSMTIFDLEAGGVVSNLEQIAFEPLRRVREVKGLLADLVAEAQANPSNDLICAILLDEGAIVEPAAQLRPFYPNILQTLREKKKDLVTSTAGRAQSKLDDPVGVISEFVAYVRGEKPSESEQGVVVKLLDEPIREEV